MPTLYVTEPGARIEKEHGRLLVTKEDEVLAAVPLAHVSEVVLVGSVGVTTPALLSLLDNGVGLTLVSATGQMRGRLRPAEARNLPLRAAQYARMKEEGFCREVSRAIVLGKLRNCRTLARRAVRGETPDPPSQPPNVTGISDANSSAPSPNLPSSPSQTPNTTGISDAVLSPTGALRDVQGIRSANELGEAEAEGEGEVAAAFERMKTALGQAARAQDLAQLRGAEGLGSKAYFHILRGALRAGMSFEKRTRRPPKDEANALLSLCYALLTNAIFTACEVAGLDAYAGFFHADKYGRPALALDLMEEFRPVVADSVVLTVVNKRMVGPEDFVADEATGGVRLSRRGLKVVLQQFTHRTQTEVYHPTAERALSYQKVFEVQARALRKCIERGEPGYVPFAVK